MTPTPAHTSKPNKHLFILSKFYVKSNKSYLKPNTPQVKPSKSHTKPYKSQFKPSKTPYQAHEYANIAISPQSTQRPSAPPNA